jgi:hypothetical protein
MRRAIRSRSTGELSPARFPQPGVEQQGQHLGNPGITGNPPAHGPGAHLEPARQFHLGQAEAPQVAP